MYKKIGLMFAIIIGIIFLGMAIATSWAFNTIENPPQVPILEGNYLKYADDLNSYANTWKSVGDITDALVPGQAFSLNFSSVLEGNYNDINIITPSTSFKAVLAVYWLIFFVSLISIFVLFKLLKKSKKSQYLREDMNYREPNRYKQRPERSRFQNEEYYSGRRRRR